MLSYQMEKPITKVVTKFKSSQKQATVDETEPIFGTIIFSERPNPKIPDTDSIAELAQFWQDHDLTDFDDQLEEVTPPVFERKEMMAIPLAPQEIEMIQKIAEAEGIDLVDLMRGWVLEKIQAA